MGCRYKEHWTTYAPDSSFLRRTRCITNEDEFDEVQTHTYTLTPYSAGSFLVFIYLLQPH